MVELIHIHVSKIIILTLKECYRDGGSKLYKDGENNEYYLDGGIFSNTQGTLFLGNEASHDVQAIGTFQLTDKREIITQKEIIKYEKSSYPTLMVILAVIIFALLFILACVFVSLKTE